MSDSQQREAERLEADLRMAERANVERYRHEQHLLKLEAQRTVSPSGSRSVSPPSRPVTPPLPESESQSPISTSAYNTKEGETALAPIVAEEPEKTRWQGRIFLITLNQEEKWPRLREYLHTRPVEYMYAAHEVAPTTGHDHMHIFIMFSRKIALYKSKTEGARIDIVTQTWWNALEYCKKQGMLVEEYGECPIRSANKKGISIKDVMEMDQTQILELRASSFNYVRNIRSELLNTQIRNAKHYAPIDFEWYYGPTGTGKSRKAFQEGATPIQYANGFFTDWAGSKVLVYEEFRGQVPYHLILQLTDAYHGYYCLNIKGGFRVLDIDKLIVTSPLRPEECYPRQCQKRDSIQQLVRRITKLLHFTEDGEQLEEDPTDLHLPPPADFTAQQTMGHVSYDD